MTAFLKETSFECLKPHGPATGTLRVLTVDFPLEGEFWHPRLQSQQSIMGLNMYLYEVEAEAAG